MNLNNIMFLLKKAIIKTTYFLGSLPFLILKFQIKN